MKFSMRANNPNSLDFTMTITMPYSEWKNLRNQLGDNSYPSWKLSSAIADLVGIVEKSYETEHESKP